MTSPSFFIGLFVVWAVVSAVWVVLMICRGLIGMREEDQVYLHRGEESLVREQQEVTGKLKRLTPYLFGSGILSIVLLVALCALYLYRGWTTGG